MNIQSQAYTETYQGEPAVWLTYGPYEAAVLPGLGANLIAFRDTTRGFRFLREPEPHAMDAFKSSPTAHGIPVLFPPNRYADGKFRWNGQHYQFPVNEEATGNHLHGFVHSIPWTVEGFAADALESRVTLTQTVGPGHPAYDYLPHRFTIRLRYTLSGDGLSQHVLVRNDGREPLPCLLAFHTALNTPFDPGSTEADYRLTLPIGERWELDERMLPTGRKVALTPEEAQLKNEGVSPFFAPLDHHYTAAPRNGRNAMVLTDTRTGVKLVYDAGIAFGQWMIWNCGAEGGFFCPEPQINVINAPNLDLPADEIGLVSLQPGEMWEETGRLYVIDAD